MSKQKQPIAKSGPPSSTPSKSSIENTDSNKVKSTTEIFEQILEVSSISGPLPPPQILEAYDRIIPQSAERLLRLVELQSEHRRFCEVKSLEAQIAISKRGQILAFVLSLVGFGSALFTAHIGESTVASILGGGTLLGLASIFIRGYREKKAEVSASKK